MKKATLAVLGSRGITRLFHPFMKDRATVFMLHRFLSPELGVNEGLDLAELRRGLEMLRARRYEIVSLEEIIRRLSGDGPSPSGAIAFTIDDGYLEQALAAGPAFAAYDCPVTTFVTSGFLDGTLWFWWNRIAYVFAHTRRTALTVQVGDSSWEMGWINRAERATVESDFVERCTTIADAEKHAAIEMLAVQAEVELPAKPPRGQEPMSWDQLRFCETRGMTFGPHTVTHPILSRTSDQASQYELEESWRRLAAEARRPTKVFCYPNGSARDYGSREIATLQRMGFLGAVVGTRGYPARNAISRGGEAAYRVRRVEYPVQASSVIRFVSGMERLNLALRGFE